LDSLAVAEAVVGEEVVAVVEGVDPGGYMPVPAAGEDIAAEVVDTGTDTAVAAAVVELAEAAVAGAVHTLPPGEAVPVPGRPGQGVVPKPVAAWLHPLFLVAEVLRVSPLLQEGIPLRPETSSAL
jgi:hypothetical protein